MISRRKSLLLVAVIIAAPVLFLAWRYYWLRWTPDKLILSKETTYIIEPLDEAGYPDYYAALNERMSQGVTPENNAAVTLLQIFGPEAFRLVENTDEYWRLLGIDALPETNGYYEDWVNWQQHFADSRQPNESDGGATFAGNKPTDALVETYFRPWRRAEFPQVAQWIESQQKHLDATVAASKRPRFFSPLVREGDLPLLTDSSGDMSRVIRDAAGYLTMRAMLRIGEGEFQRAWEDLISCNRLGLLLAQSPMLLDAQMGMVTYNSAFDGQAIFLGTARLDVEEWATIRHEYDALPKPPSLSEKLDLGTRFAYLDLVCATARHGVPSIDRKLYGDPKKRKDPSPLVSAPVGVDWNVPLRMANQWMDRYVNAAATADPVDRTSALTALDWEAQAVGALAGESQFFSEIFSQATASEHMGRILVGAFYSGLANVGLLEEHNRAYRPLTSVGLALAHYKAERRAYPDRLRDLVPDYFDALPVDPYTEKPFRYRKTETGYRLYSVGVNRKDEGGKTYNNDDQSDDLVIEVPWRPKAKPMVSVPEDAN